MTVQDFAVKEIKGFRLSAKAQKILALLSEHWGINERAVLENLLRDAAKTENLNIE